MAEKVSKKLHNMHIFYTINRKTLTKNHTFVSKRTNEQAKIQKKTDIKNRHKSLKVTKKTIL